MSANSHKRKLVRPEDAERWSMTTLRDKLIKIGAKVVRHGRSVTFQLAEIAIPRRLFAEILRLHLAGSSWPAFKDLEGTARRTSGRSAPCRANLRRRSARGAIRTSAVIAT